MGKASSHSVTTHKHKVVMLSVYDNMQKSAKKNFQTDHKPYQFATIKRIKKST